MSLSRRALCLSLPALALTASCGSRPAPPPRAVSSPPASPRMFPPRFYDRDPVDFTGRHPGRFAIHGIDLARFQSDVDWRQAHAAGVSFAFIKATEGGDILDPMFKTHRRGAAAAGLPWGAYHFYYFCTPPEVQARWFIRNVPPHPGMLPPVLDMEWNAFSPTCRLRPPGAEIRALARRFMAALEAHYGQRPLLYTTPGFARDTGITRLPEEFWLRSTAETPARAYPRQRWRFWQYTGTGIVPGIAGETDINVFNGSAADWAAWLAARRVH